MPNLETRPLSALETIGVGVRLTIGFVLVSVSALLWMGVAVLLLPWRPLRIKLCNYYGKFIGYSVVRLAGARPSVRDRQRIDGSFPAIYVANHASVLDAFISIWLCPVGGCGVVKRQVAKIPFFGQLYQLSGHLMLDRENSGRAIAALNETAEVVKRYRLGIWIMPEGTRSQDGRLLPFKPGFVHLAIATGLPIVPVIFHNVHRIWPSPTLRIYGGELPIDVLPPIDTSGWKRETARQHADAVHDLMAEALDDAQRPLVQK